MMESISRGASTKLVLREPLPELLSDKPKPPPNAKSDTGHSQAKHATAGTAFPRRTELFSEPQQTGIPIYNSWETGTCKEQMGL